MKFPNWPNGRDGAEATEPMANSIYRQPAQPCGTLKGADAIFAPGGENLPLMPLNATGARWKRWAGKAIASGGFTFFVEYLRDAAPDRR